jgi:GTP cyclohydrolase I
MKDTTPEPSSSQGTAHDAKGATATPEGSAYRTPGSAATHQVGAVAHQAAGASEHLRTPSRSAGADRHTGAAARIRSRIEAAGRRFHANDNIAEFIDRPAELKELEDQVTAHMQGLLEALVIDTVSDHNTRATARRVARMFLHEVFKGRYHPMPAVTEFPNAARLNELMIVGPITVRSACSHHLVPILGKLWIGVLPSERSSLVGLSKYSRIADWIMSRPQIQEEAVMQLADLLEARLRPEGLAIVLEADHFCMHWRGVKDESHMTNSVMRGAFLTNPESRKEFLQLVRP